MWFRRCFESRRVVGSLVCASLVLSMGCAGSPLRLRRKGLNIADNAVDRAEQVVQTEGQTGQAGVVTLDSIGQSQAQQQPAEQQLELKPRRNFAQIFETGPKQNSQADPFLAQQETPAAAPAPTTPTQTAQRPTQTASAPPATTRTTLQNGFDDAMAELATKTAQQPASPQPTQSEDFNPFAAFTGPSDVAATKPSDPTADALASELAQSLKTKTEAAKPQPQTNANPFAQFVGQTAEQQPQPAPAVTQKPVAQHDSSTDWIKNATAGLAQQPAAQQATAAQTPTASDSDVMEVAARERVRQLLDSAELALRGGRYDDAETIATRAYEIVQSENLTYGSRDRTPTTLLRRIVSAKRLTDDTPSQPFAALESEPNRAEPTLEVTDASPPVTTTTSFDGFSSVATWQAVGDDDSAFAAPKATAAVEPVIGGSTWTTDDSTTTAAVPGPPEEKPAVETAMAPTQTTAPRWNGDASTTYQPASFSSEQPAPPAQKTLPAPSWSDSESDASSNAPGISAPAFPQWQVDEEPSQADTASTKSSMPELPEFGSSEPARSPWATPAWTDEEEPAGEQLAMATLEIAPAPPTAIIADASPAANPSVNYGNILALMTVIGLGLVAVIAFRTKPEEI